MVDSTIPAPLVYAPAKARKDILSAIMTAARQFGRETVALVDGDGTEVPYKNILRGAFGLGSAFRRMTKKDEVVGIMLPTGAGATVAFCAVLAAGRIPAMINFSAGVTNIRSALKTANISKVVTAHKFIDLGELHPLISDLSSDAEFVYIDDLREELTLKDKLSALAGPYLSWLVRRKPNHKKPAVILFTSGTEGVPKGVVLSHENIVANVEQVRAHIGLSPENDSVFNPLPAFHCFGLTVGTILPLVAGVRQICHPTPLQPREIATRIGETQSTLLLATDTFISQYARASNETNLQSVRLAVCGAERVKDETRQMVRRKFGIEILEGYGATEAAPVVAANSMELNKPGTVGKLMSDMEVYNNAFSSDQRTFFYPSGKGYKLNMELVSQLLS
ncbi:MAG: AMP-binding protein, partial [Pseudomonadota bacterium]